MVDYHGSDSCRSADTFDNLKMLGQWVQEFAVGFMRDGKTYRLVKGGNGDNPINRLMIASGMPSRFGMELAEHPGWKAKA